MAGMVKVELLGSDEALLFLEEMKRRMRGEEYVSVIVGYGTDYALYQHENLQFRHEPPTKAKFLTDPARSSKKQFRRIINRVMYRGGTFGMALIGCAELLATKSRVLVPVDTGLLRSTLTIRRED